MHKLELSGRAHYLAAAVATWAVVFGASGLLAGASAAALPPGCSQSGAIVSCSVTFTSGSNPFTVPAGVSSIHVLAVGGMGGSSEFCPVLGGCTPVAAGGFGATVNGDLNVASNTTLYAVVGANGASGGGAGGGASDVRMVANDPTTRLLVAAGGGGAGGPGPIFFGTEESPGGSGGAGGAAGAAGAPGSPVPPGPASAGNVPATGGGPGSDSAGGAGGAGGIVSVISNCSPACTGDSGSPGAVELGGAGGAGGSTYEVGHVSLEGGAGGGGGGGLFGGGGGGGGAPSAGGAGGGGGSSLVPAGGSESVDSTGVPLVQISYELVPTSKDQCKGGGWQDYPQFANQGQCVRFVETGT